MVRDAQRQSEQDFPRMSIRNGVTDSTKMCIGHPLEELCGSIVDCVKDMTTLKMKMYPTKH